MSTKKFQSHKGLRFAIYTKYSSELQNELSLEAQEAHCRRFFDNIFVERLWRIVKYEDICIKEYATVSALFTGLSDYFDLYNYERPNQSLGYYTPTTL